jgi:hypothetical protein
VTDHADNIIDLNAILHPASVYHHPRDVVGDPTISIEKRAILASWPQMPQAWRRTRR